MLNFDVKQQEIRLYENGAYFRTGIKYDSTDTISGDGRIVIGKNDTVGRGGYTSAEVDELYIYNELLPESKIRMLSQQQMSSCVQ